MSPPVFSRRAVAALFLARQHLDRPRGRRLTATSLARFVEDTGGLQIDSINVLERAHYLTAWSRFGPYPRAALDRIAYRRRVLIEYWAHAACFVPASHLEWWRRAMADYQARHTGWSGWLRKNARVMRVVEEAIRANGPQGNADFKQARPTGAAGWWNWKPTTYALHFLWMTGRVGIHSRENFQKRFDLTERLIPGFASLEPPPEDAFRRWHLERSLHAMGAATELDLRMYLTFPRQPRGVRRKTLERALASGEVVEIAIEGERTPWYALARDLAALERAGRARAPSRGTTLLSPFDSFLWHRARTQRLFGFDYRIEVYTPGHKRVHGYYSLPILHDGQLIGRLDAKNHRSERRLEVRNLHFEPWFAGGKPAPAARWGMLDREQALDGLAEALGSLARFLEAERITLGRVTPAKLAGGLARAVGALGTGARRAESPVTRGGDADR